jgi:hypothetical protein
MAAETPGHSPDGSDVDEAFEARIGPVREALAALLDASDQLSNERGWLPAADSPAMAELADGAQFKGSSTWGDPIQAAHNWGQLLVVHTGDCARALVRELSQSAAPVYAQFVLARAVLEAAGRAWWLFEPGIGLRLRVARVINERIFGLHQQLRLPLPEEYLARARERLNELFAEAARLGFGTVGGPRADIGYLEETRPGQTELVTNLLSADGDSSLEAFVYGFFSAVAHGTTFGLTSSVEANAPSAPRTPGVTWGAVKTRSPDVVHVLAAVILGTREAQGRRNELFGWASESWEAAAREALQSVRQATGPGPSAP